MVNKKSFVVLLLLFLFGCTTSMVTYKEQFNEIDKLLLTGNYSEAVSKLEADKDVFYKKKDRVVYYLDLGMLCHYAGEYEKSNEYLTKAETAIKELYTKSVSRAVTSLLLNDNVLEYSGEDYEDIYLNIFKALNYIELNQPDEAFVEIRRVNEKLHFLENKYKKIANQYNLSKDKKKEFKAGENKFHNSALARFFSLLLYRAEGNFDDARIDLKKIKEAWKDQSQIYDFSMPNLDSGVTKTNKARLDLIAFTGRSPDKKAKTLYIHTEKDVIFIATTDETKFGKQNLETLDTIPWKGIEKGYHFKFQLPYMKNRKSQVKYVKVKIDKQQTKKLEKIEDISLVASTTFKIKEPILYLKTITRAIVKGLFAEKRKKEMENQIKNPLLGFAARMATDMLVDASENADLRIARYFPDKALISEIELKPGKYHIQVEYYGENNTVLYVDDKGEIECDKDKLNIVESYYLE